MTSCCPAWVKFFEHQFPDMKDIPSTAKSPQQMFGAIAKTYFADKINCKREDMVVVSVMPCLSKKYECSRDEFKTNGNPEVDFSISTRELAHLIKLANIDFVALPDEDFDGPLGQSTGAAVIFGTTGGVIEAAVRTVYEVFTGQTLPKIDFTELRGLEGIRAATIELKGIPIHIGIAHGLGNARKLLEQIREGKCQFHAIEIMACPGGCIDGGGQPLHHGNSNIIKERWEAIYQADREMPIRKSHENPSIIEIYKEFLGKPCGHKSHELLHTHYFDRKNEIVIDLTK
jgi:NADP-reducing hydrogenase subunit HndD